jgi:hypothetical protein
MDPGLVRGEQSGIDLLLNVGVVLGELASLAVRMAVRTRSPASSSLRPRSEPMVWEVILTAISLATSPAACPPMPSATMKIPCSDSIK